MSGPNHDGGLDSDLDLPDFGQDGPDLGLDQQDLDLDLPDFGQDGPDLGLDLPDSDSSDSGNFDFGSDLSQADMDDLDTSDIGLELGPCPVPSNGRVEGDFLVDQTCSPYYFTEEVTIAGDLLITANSEVHFNSPVEVEGSLNVAEGGTLVCVYPLSNFLSVSGTSSIVGTADNPVRVTRIPAVGYNNACHLRPGETHMRYAHLSSIPVHFGAGSTVADTRFDGEANDGTWNFVYAHEGATFEFIDFVDSSVQGYRLTIRSSHFQQLSARTHLSFATANHSGLVYSCGGDRSLAPELDIQNNVFDNIDLPGQNTLFRVAREFGAANISGNYIQNTTIVSPNAYDGGDTGCDDEMGYYGGPLTFLPSLPTRPPSYGIRD